MNSINCLKGFFRTEAAPLPPTPSASPPPIPATESKQPPALFRENIQHTLLAPLSFDEKGQSLLTLIQRQNRRAWEKVTTFIHQHQEKCTLMKEKGWNGLKKEKGALMKTKRGKDGLTFEQFREEAVQHVIALCLSVIQEMGFVESGKYVSSGTVGYQSDIDIVYIAPKEMSEEVKVTEKMLFDVLWNSLFGGLSGQQAEVESYLKHPGDSYDTYRALLTEEEKAHFTYLEMSAASLQMRRELRDAPEEWSKYYERQVLAAPIAMRPLISNILKEVESLEDEVEAGSIKQILQEEKKTPFHELQEMPPYVALQWKKSAEYKELLAKKPDIVQKAKKNYTISLLLELSKRIDQDKQELVALHRQMNAQQMHLTKPERDTISKQIDRVQLQIAARSTLRNYFFNESYLTQGAFNKTCLLAGGQIQQRREETVLKKRRKSIMQQEPFLPIGLHLGIKQKMLASSVECLASQQENFSMYMGHFLTRSSDEGEIPTLIAASKYSVRALDASVHLLSLIENQVPLEKKTIWNDLQKRCSEIAQTVHDLETCKRKQQISASVTYSLLCKALTQSEKNSEKKALLETRLRELCFKPELEAKLLVEEKLLLLAAPLADLHLIKIKRKVTEILVTNARVNAILRARAGFPIIETTPSGATSLKRDIQEIHKEAEKIIINTLQLEKPGGISQLNGNIERIITDVRNFCMETGLIPLTFDQEISLQKFLPRRISHEFASSSCPARPQAPSPSAGGAASTVPSPSSLLL